jgi:hypothetical protein
MNIFVGLSPWILSDGNYRDFKVGDEREFALEFSGEELSPAGESAIQGLKRLGSSNYSACGEVIYQSVEMSKVVYSADPNLTEIPEYVWICDFGGVQAYCNHAPPDWAQVGSRVGGEIYLARKRSGMPKLTYRMLIRHIFLEVTPMVPDPEGKYAAIPDETRTEVREVATTEQPPWDHRAPGATLPGPPGQIVPSTQSHFVLECDILESGVDAVVGTG